MSADPIIKKTASDRAIDEIKHRLSQEIAKNEHREKEILHLKEELNNLRSVHSVTTEIATIMEEDLKSRIDKYKKGFDTDSVLINGDIVELNRRLALIISENEFLKSENLRKEDALNELRMLYTTITESATILENELHGKYEKVSLAAITDPLTNIFNRAGFIKSFNDQMKNKQFKFSVLMFDIDHFKKVNDTFGHDVGDLALKNVVYVAEKTIRNGDVLARWGGEEFIILLPGIDSTVLKRIAERTRRAIEKHPFPEVGQVTCSFGATQYRITDNLDTLLKRVDKGLYEAKEGGRNRVVYK